MYLTIVNQETQVNRGCGRELGIRIIDIKKRHLTKISSWFAEVYDLIIKTFSGSYNEQFNETVEER